MAIDYVYSHNLLINQATGQFDHAFIKKHALVRAQREYGGLQPPVTYVRPEIRYLRQQAEIMRKRWRLAHGLPDDTVYEMRDISGWTDTFRRTA